MAHEQTHTDGAKEKMRQAWANRPAKYLSRAYREKPTPNEHGFKKGRKASLPHNACPSCRRLNGYHKLACPLFPRAVKQEQPRLACLYCGYLQGKHRATCIILAQ